nr:peptidylprolyl isomerase [uncultured Shuttleworthia sp.]
MKRIFASLAALGLAGALLISGCGINAKANLIKVSQGEGIELGYGNFVARLMQAQYDASYRSYYGDSYWTTDMSGKGKTLEQQVKETVADSLKQQYVARQHAADFNISISEEESKKIGEAADKFLAANSEEAVRQLGAERDYVVRFFEDQYYYYHVEQALEGQADTTVSDEEANQKKFSYVKFAFQSTDSSTGKTSQVTEEQKADLMKQAKTLSTSADFDTTAKQMKQTVQTANYGKSDVGDKSYKLPQAVLTALEGMEVGKVSDVVTVDNDGYYVLRLDSLSDADATAAKKKTLENKKKTEHAEEVFKQWENEDGMTLNEAAWSKVKFNSLFQTKGQKLKNQSGTNSGSTGASS